MRITAIVTLLIVVASCNQPTQKENPGKMPNIVIIYADDMGYGDMSCQNPKAKFQTPNLDRLASQGIRFTDGHSSSGICTPSRFALLTGQYHWRRFHGIVNAFGKSVFEKDEFTVPRMLQQQGYTTACIGKWHLGWDWQFLSEPSGEVFQWGRHRSFYRPDEIDFDNPISGGPLDQGFDYYFGDGTINFPPYAFVENDRFVEKPTVDLDLQGKETLEGEWEFRYGPMVKDWDPFQVLPTLTIKAVEYVKRQTTEQPFFLYFALPCPHAPIIPNDEFIGSSKAGGYGDFIVQTDYVVGRILLALEEQGYADETLVIFTADNGPEHYAYDRIRNFDHRSMGSLRGLKRDIWEGGHRVPFIIRWPGFVEPGSVSAEVISQVDLAATLASITGYDLSGKAAVDSYDLLPLIRGQQHRTPFREATIQNTYENRYAIRQGDWLLIDSFSGEHTKSPDWFNEQNDYRRYEEDNPGLLYNVAEDISQKNNLYVQYPERIKEMKALLIKYKQEGTSYPRP